MTQPLCIRPGRYWLITRRTLMRMFLLRPEAWVRELFDYAVARAAAASGVEVVGGLCMSTHYHLVVRDPLARLPLFSQVLNELLARAANAEWERSDHFFESGSPHYLPLLTGEAIEDALVYALANPCEARLVARSRAWGGWQTPVAALGTRREVARPALRFFSERATSPGSETLTLHVPERYDSAETFRRKVAKRLAAREKALMEEAGGYLGMEKVLSFPWRETARAEEAPRAPVPKSKAGLVERAAEIHRTYVVGLALFWQQHREALEHLRQGAQAEFPYGTYQWRVSGGQACAGAQSDDRALFV